MRVAIIEDERKLAETLSEGLTAEGYETSVFFDAESFRESLHQPGGPSIDLAILDLGLPLMGGLELSRSLRSVQFMTPILVLTAHDTIEAKVQALDNGADDFLAKPFNFDELMARIRALLRRAHFSPQAHITRGDLVVDTKLRQVSRAGKEIVLTPTEFDLLILLLEKHGEPLSREEISNVLWSMRDAALSNIVDVHISNLRKKLDGNYATKHISTVRGLGYSIAP